MEVEFADYQEENDPDRGDSSEATGAVLGCLEQVVDGLQETIGLACLSPSHDTLHVSANHLGDLLHRIDLGSHHESASL